jgi:hypothetical protein
MARMLIIQPVWQWLLVAILVGFSIWSCKSAYQSGNWVFYIFAAGFLAVAVLYWDRIIRRSSNTD